MNADKKLYPLFYKGASRMDMETATTTDNEPTITMETEPTTTMDSKPLVDSELPHIHLLCMLQSFSKAFDDAVDKHFPDIHSQVNITTHHGMLDALSDDLALDAIVSPANSYGRLDGAFDDAISRELSPKGDYHWTTRQAQKVLYEKWKGFAPPGTCTVIPLLEGENEDEGEGAKTPVRQLRWGVKHILLCPTMRIPQQVKWDREVVYECIWSMLCAIDAHNKDAPEDDKIKSILMTPLATGVGLVPYPRWAGQCVLAIRDWLDASQNPDKWSNLSWRSILINAKDTQDTY